LNLNRETPNHHVFASCETFTFTGLASHASVDKPSDSLPQAASTWSEVPRIVFGETPHFLLGAIYALPSTGPEGVKVWSPAFPRLLNDLGWAS
jgi:hypothetical protein